MCGTDEQETTLRNGKVLQIFVELPEFTGNLQGIDESTPLLEKLAYVFMEMADCNEIPDNLHAPLLERIFKASDTVIMKQDTKDNYMRSILGEADYEANLEDWKEEGIGEGRAERRDESIMAMARTTKDMGYTEDEICRITHLENEVIESLF